MALLRNKPKGCLVALLSVLLVAAVSLGAIWYQAQWKAARKAEYVAMGSSFAAGAGLGRLEPGSPWLCARSVNGYPQQLARKLNLSIADMTCGGAVTANLLNGGQFFQGPQTQAISKYTRLVTITVGGNDIGYIGDLSMLAARNTDTIFGTLVRWFWKGPRRMAERNFDNFEIELTATVEKVQRIAPSAKIVLVTYPTILPPAGTCELISLTQSEAMMMRRVADQLANSTYKVAANTGIQLVNMHQIGKQHNACAKVPWSRGWINGSISPFHPNHHGSRVTSQAIADEL